MVSRTLYCKTVAKEIDLLGYQTLVFKNLDKAPFGYEYCMTTVFPNWESRVPDISEIGYLYYDEVVAGIDNYYDRITGTFIKYNYSNLIFKKFIKEVDSSKKDIII